MQSADQLLQRLPPSLTSLMNLKQGAIVLVATWAIWRLLKTLTAKDPLSVVPGPKSEHWYFGNLLKLFTPGYRDYMDMLAGDYPRLARIPSVGGASMLYTADPKAMYSVLVKDSSSWDVTPDFIRTNLLMFGPGLLATVDEQHRKQRKLLNPVFSIAHMREMIPTFYEVAHRLRDSISTTVSAGETEMNMLEWTTRTALELIGRSGLGTSIDSLEPEGKPHPYATSIKNLMQAMVPLTFSRFAVLPKVVNIGTPQFRRWVVDMLPWGNLQKLVRLIDIMHNTSMEIYARKKKALVGGDGVAHEEADQGKDIISILLRENMAASEEDRLPEHEVLGQMSTITFAAMDTSSNALSRILYLLSECPEVQQRLRAEILDAKQHNGDSDLSYDELVQLPYLDAVCRETLRLYPPLPLVIRESTQDTILPVSKPIITTKGAVASEVHVPKGTPIVIAIYSSNTDPELWGPDAKEWKPERWLEPLPEQLTSAKIPGIYSHLMTFIGGGRSCIGFKFSQLEMKVVLCALLESFRFSPTDKKVIWLNNGIVQPAVEEPESNGSPRLQLPLKVSLL
ncbi:cytochrome P450 [Coprinopsis cinerea okayama7|uniref:Cytochrome P450 n=1 Tax=Coprinopsis cinerea (strain Okayama-7 / 130 / ATCC MYA-4618 / FGSC 9003) TaxID=240176 RepID=A8NWU2_COPC7|nr:cytochrome P450 [Coprinopsis cinerea okayama7\|eukprot:XP_001836986.2 cytochrome P450 [Coprinopsis cinerea okayama7\